MGKTETRSTASSADKNSNDNIELLINKVCTHFVNQLETKFDKKFDKLDERLSNINESMKGLYHNVEANQKAIRLLESKCNYLEQCLKRNTLRCHGVKETQNENVLDVILAFINTTLNVTCSVNDVNAVYRVGKSIGNKPRAIVVSFISNLKCMGVFSARKLLRNTEFSIFEDLPSSRYKLLLLAKERYGNKQAWCSSGKIYVIRDNVKCLVNSEHDL